MKDKRLWNTRRVNILGLDIDVLTMNQTVDLVEEYVKRKAQLHLMGVNADKINECQKNLELAKIVNNCGVINADGASVVLASRFLKKSLPERVAGIDLMLNLVRLSAEKDYSIYLLGAKKEVVFKTKNVLMEQFPSLRIVGIHDGYFEDNCWKDLSDEIKGLNPDFVFVGITSPKKEYLIEYLQSEGNSSVFMGVGGSFDVISGEIARAPHWMQKANLEWLFRMMQEPKRLFKRYFFGNSKFIYMVVKEKMKRDRGFE
ncbi:WecB/TagA/CpsF family glycosyltransferase [Faecalibaculum rodentium]|uniref:WecB/TagA/CpsF family glycosyltransferase n=1 Tax=Faecalibaculum rodentium TaxID=1702221 RepID=UPI0027316934|nr:WecB/TagA/CpsF family glycosyltransferase [Faecalibaculum rodentium]